MGVLGVGWQLTMGKASSLWILWDSNSRSLALWKQVSQVPSYLRICLSLLSWQEWLAACCPGLAHITNILFPIISQCSGETQPWCFVPGCNSLSLKPILLFVCGICVHVCACGGQRLLRVFPCCLPFISVYAYVRVSSQPQRSQEGCDWWSREVRKSFWALRGNKGSSLLMGTWRRLYGGSRPRSRDDSERRSTLRWSLALPFPY